MKRYLVFCGENYYPYGGMEDFIGDYDTIDECQSILHSTTIVREILEDDYDDGVVNYPEWSQIWDSVERKIIKKDFEK